MLAALVVWGVEALRVMATATRVLFRWPSVPMAFACLVMLGVGLGAQLDARRWDRLQRDGISPEQARAIAQRYARESLADAPCERLPDGDREVYRFTVPTATGEPIRYEVDAHGMGYGGYRRLGPKPPARAVPLSHDEAKRVAIAEVRRVAGRRVRQFEWEAAARVDGSFSVMGESKDVGLPVSLWTGWDFALVHLRADGEVDLFCAPVPAGRSTTRWFLASMVANALLVAVAIAEVVRRTRAKRREAAA